jgi:hypothetical protein
LLAQNGICSGIEEYIEEYTTSVTGFIKKCIEDVVPTVTVLTYPNQKPWITGNIRNEGRAAIKLLGDYTWSVRLSVFL